LHNLCQTYPTYLHILSHAAIKLFGMAQPKSRLPLFLGLTVAGAGGYYLYSAGGNPKVAEKKIER